MKSIALGSVMSICHVYPFPPPHQLAHTSPFVEGRIVVIDGPAVVKRLEDLRAFWQFNQHPSLFLDIAE